MSNILDWIISIKTHPEDSNFTTKAFEFRMTKETAEIIETHYLTNTSLFKYKLPYVVVSYIIDKLANKKKLCELPFTQSIMEWSVIDSKTGEEIATSKPLEAFIGSDSFWEKLCLSNYKTNNFTSISLLSNKAYQITRSSKSHFRLGNGYTENCFKTYLHLSSADSNGDLYFNFRSVGETTTIGHFNTLCNNKVYVDINENAFVDCGDTGYKNADLTSRLLLIGDNPAIKEDYKYNQQIYLFDKRVGTNNAIYSKGYLLISSK